MTDLAATHLRLQSEAEPCARCGHRRKGSPTVRGHDGLLTECMWGYDPMAPVQDNAKQCLCRRFVERN